MAVREVIIYPDPILRNKNTEVTTFDEDLKKLTDDMFDTMYEFEGIGLAGPQIAVNKRIVVIDIPDDEGNQHKNQLVIINPKITKLEGDIVESQEGCLSVPQQSASVLRSLRVKVKYQDIDMNEKEIEADGLLAHCLQHEIDHTNGIVYIDYLSKLKRDNIIKKVQKLNKFKN